MTPRRILMLVGGLVACAAGYLVYARLLGRFDGLPALPARMLVHRKGEFTPPPRPTSPTIELLRQAFGENCPEADSTVYELQLQFHRDERGSLLVLASGRPPAEPRSERVTLSPFSLAVFGRPRPEHLRKPGEVNEVSTIHSDRAVLEFDRVIETATDMNTAKLVRVELVSDPGDAVRDALGRRGQVHLTTNQRSADPDRRLVIRTVGPVFYRDPKPAPNAPPPTGPDVFTDAPVELVDRGNLPRRPGEPVGPVAAADCRTPAAVAAVLGGQRLPPPTVTAVGMRVYLDNDKPKEPKDKPRAGSAGFASVRRVEFQEQVVMSLWAESGQGLVGSGRGPAPPESPGLAAGGGLVAGMSAARALGRDLLRVETRGPFSYDADKNLARFDVLPVADPNLPNDVQVTKVSARPGVQTLLSQVLELEFNGPPAGTPPDSARKVDPPPGGARFKRLHAWTYTPGRFLTLSSDAEQLEAHGQDLVRDEAEGRTTLTGAPLYAVQKRNVLSAGGAKTPAKLVVEPEPGTTPADRRSRTTVFGVGKAELLDPASGGNTVTAEWQTSLVQSREQVNDREVELYTLTDGARFADEKADFWLKGRVLKLWLARPAPGEPAPPDAANRARPHRLLAVGDVTGHSADMDVEQADQLNTWFRDDVPPPAPAVAAPPGPPAAGPQPAPPPVAPAPPKQPEKPPEPKPPTRLRARTIDTWVVRTPRPAPKPGADGGLKYELEKARCDGSVSVQQDPADPAKGGGTKILGSRLLVDGSPEGNVMTVFGWDDKPGEVHNDGTSLIGPKVVLDQVHNKAEVEGRGSLTMPASSDLGGAALRRAEPVIVHFRDRMLFLGANKLATFAGKVTATQDASQVVCHTLQVQFDRPVYFTPANRPAAPPGKKDPADKPKIERVLCYPAPGDAADSPGERRVRWAQVDRDPDTGKPFRRQQLVASELDLHAQARDAGGEPYRLAVAAGPGLFRVWEPGAKDDPAGPARPGAPAESEMKLTVVGFEGRMTAKDKGKAYQEATFTDDVWVVHLPTDDPDLAVSRAKPPAGSVLLTCVRNMVVWTHRRPGEPARQHLKAHGNAYLRNDEYDGSGDTITHEGRQIVFDSDGGIPARIKSRFGGNDQIGRRIIYDRAANRFEVQGSLGGTFFSPPPKK